jgi:hypothetical protein
MLYPLSYGGVHRYSTGMITAARRLVLLIVWWSRTGASDQLAHAAAEAASTQNDVETIIKRCDGTRPEDVLNASGYLFVAPENLASLAGMMKEFFDRTYYPVLDRINGRPYAQIISAGSDGQGAARQLARIATGWRLRAIAEPVIVNVAAQTPEAILAMKRLCESELQRARDLGAALAAGIAIGVW